MLYTHSAPLEINQVLGNGKQNKPFGFIDFIFRRAPLITLIGGTVTIVSLLMLLPFYKASYESHGMLLLDPTKQVTVQGRELDPFPGIMRDYIRTTALRINTIDVLIQAIGKLKTEEFPSFLNPEADIITNARRLSENITVKELPYTNLISLTIKSDTPKGTAETLNNVMKVFVEKNQIEKRQLLEGRIAYLVQEREKIIAREKEYNDKRKQIISRLPNEIFVNAKFDVHLADLELARKLFLEARSKSEESRLAYEQAKINKDLLSKISLKPLADEKATDNLGINRMELWTYEQRAALRKSIDGLTKENSDRRIVEERLENMEEYLSNYRNKTENLINQQMIDKRTYELDLAVKLAKSSADAAAEHAKILEQASIDAMKDHNIVAKGIFDLIDLDFDSDQLRERLKTLNTRIDDAEVEATAPVQIFIDGTAKTPDLAAGSNLKIILLISAVIGIGFVGSFLLAFDIIDDRIRDKSDMDSALGGASADPIPVLEGIDFPPGAISSINNLKNHPVSVAIRKLAIRLSLENQTHDTKIFAITGLSARSGVTSIALNLSEILKSNNVKVLMIECNLGHAGLAKLHGGIEGSPGLSDWMIGKIDSISKIVQHDPIRGIDLIPAGNIDTKIPERSKFNALIETAKDNYDLILLDSGVLLENEFTVYVSTRASAVIIVGKEDDSVYKTLRMSIDRLLGAGVPTIGAVLNYSRVKRKERIKKILHAKMNILSEKHWVYHRTIRRMLTRLLRIKQ